MKTYFIRHQQGPDQKRDDFTRLLEQRKIAIFYDTVRWEQVFDEASGTACKNYFNDAYLKSEGKRVVNYKNAILYFNELRQNGGYVFAQYLNSYIGERGQGCILGKVERGTPIEYVHKDLPVTLQLQDCKILNYADFPALLAARPQQSTICEPRRATFKHVAEMVFNKTPIPMTVDLIHHSTLEVMCAEYLRQVGVKNGSEEFKLKYLFLQPGKTLQALDICGRLNNGRTIYAQVKNDYISSDARDVLAGYLNNGAVGVIFSKGWEPIQKDNLFHINISEVFSFFEKQNPQLIKDMLGVKIAA